MSYLDYLSRKAKNLQVSLLQILILFKYVGAASRNRKHFLIERQNDGAEAVY